MVDSPFPNSPVIPAYFSPSRHITRPILCNPPPGHHRPGDTETVAPCPFSLIFRPLLPSRSQVTYLLLMMQTFIIILHNWQAFLPARDIVRRCVHDVAGQEVLPEGEAARRAYTENYPSISQIYSLKRGTVLRTKSSGVSGKLNWDESASWGTFRSH